jgi:hypothetical protein
VTIPTLTDTLSGEPIETLNLTIGGVTGTGGIVDTTGAPTLTISSPTILESAGFAQFALNMSNQSSQSTTLSLALSNGTATGGGVDFVTGLEVSTDGGISWVVASTVTIPALQTNVLVRTPIINDTLVEGNETFSLTATRIAGSQIANAGGVATGMATITDNDVIVVTNTTADDDDVNENRDTNLTNDIVHDGVISNVTSSVVLSINDAVASNLTSNGQAVSYSWNAATRTLTASTSSGAVFTVTLDASNTSYSFKQLSAIDHAVVSGENHSLNIPLTLQARDSSGVLITTSVFNLTIFDDAPSISGAKMVLTDNDGSHSETGFLSEAIVSNDNTHITWTTTGLPSLVFEGKQVLYVDNGNGTLTGQLADGTLIFRATIDTSTVNANNNPQYTFELLNTMGRLGVSGVNSTYTVISGGNANSLDLGFGGFIIDKMTATVDGSSATVNTNNGWIGVAGNWFDAGDRLFMDFVDPSGQAGQVTGLNMMVEGQGSAAYTLNWTVTAAVDASGNTITYSGSMSATGNADVPFSIPLQSGALYFTKLEVSDPAGSGSFRISFSAVTANNYFSDVSLPLSYTLTDADGDSVNGAFNVTLDADSLPTIDLDANDSSGEIGMGYRATYTENGVGVPIADVDVAISDGDSSNLTSATITLTNAQAGDLLAAGSMPTGITVSVVGNVVTLTGSASLANYQTAIRSVTYNSTSENPNTTPRIINVVVNDGQGNSNTAVTTINVVAVNDAPVGLVDVYNGANSVVEGATVVRGSVLANDTDVDSATLTVAQFATNSATIVTAANGTNSITTALGGTVVMNADGTFTYTAPVRNHSDAISDVDSFVYRTTDGSLNSNWTTVSINVTDTAPIAKSDTDSVGIGGSTTGNVLTGAGGATADSLGSDAPVAITNVTIAGALSNTLGAGNVRTVVTNNGTLVIDQDDGSYTYTSSLSNRQVVAGTGSNTQSFWTSAGIRTFGFDGSSPQTGINLNLSSLTATAAGLVRYRNLTGTNNDGLGVESSTVSDNN